MRKTLVLSIILFTIAFASVATNLIINVTTSIGVNYNDFDVYFSASYENGTKNNRLIKDDRHIVFSHSMSLVGEKYTLEYDVTNGSREYDANVSINCTNGNEHLKIVNDFDERSTLLATKTRTGVLTIELVTAYVEDTEFNITCEIINTATERDSISDGIPNDKFRPIQIADVLKSKYKGDISLIDFNTPADDTETGVYKTIGEENKDVYFYRGNVIDNNVMFAGFCWKIIRTTETGGTKLIYNGEFNYDGWGCVNNKPEIGISKWNDSNSDNAYIGYMYGKTGSNNYNDTHANINNSTIKTYIDTWYKNNLKDTSYEEYLEDAVWCNDRSTISGGENNAFGPLYGTLGYQTNPTAYGVVGRSSYYTTNVQPNLICPNENDKFTTSKENGNGDLTYPIGLLTMDEYALAGYTSNYKIDGSTKTPEESSVPETNYLYTGNWEWSLSPVYMDSINAGVGDVSTGLSNSTVSNTRGVRPSITLKPTNRIIDGDGTAKNPFIIG